MEAKIDDFKVINYIIHFINKESGKTSAQIDFSKKIDGDNEFSKTLAREVHVATNSSVSLKNTNFRNDNENSFKKRLDEYLATHQKEEFYDFSKTLEQLKEKMEKESFAVGGYFLFIDYEFQNKRFLSVVLLRKKKGLNITKVDDTYILNNIENINIDKIAMAVRLNYNIYLNPLDDRNYLALITTQQNGIISAYFREWVNTGDFIKNDKNTDSLVRIIKGIPVPQDDEGNDLYKSSADFQKAVFEYARPRKNKLINLRDMGVHFFGEGNENKFLDYATKNDMTIDPEFKRDSSIWRTLVTIRARIEGVELNVDYDKINDDEVFIGESQIIIKSKELISQMKAQIIESNDKL
ncbi:nucleoid-associated protein [Flavobacterium rhizosphaerae]|uniref:Nucleoid-associated protein n=1 Tax=Flavobacterium rhizosphaerae TaxID=3163298 RepID=A0ABW8YZR8_9FLAO